MRIFCTHVVDFGSLENSPKKTPKPGMTEKIGGFFRNSAQRIFGKKKTDDGTTKDQKKETEEVPKEMDNREQLPRKDSEIFKNIKKEQFGGPGIL